ncbi:DUF7576 family protein [Halovivax limisalsi]|uniref:DUF7576 family protein n=1 Tax=Halovivax limisalsi TaxID=1453760 RepID=UPI001FFD17B7|nr:hypothetical protein [Halovivax limisalsi]
MSERTERADTSTRQEYEVCTRCGSVIDTSDWYPIATDRIDGSVTLHPFCDETCKDAWLDGQDA